MLESSLVVGVDETNFSPSLAGDCVVCALHSNSNPIDGVKDSKLLSYKKKIKLFAEIQKSSVYSIVPATVNQINNFGVYNSRNWAMLLAINHVCGLMGDYDSEIDAVLDGYFSDKVMAWFNSLVPSNVSVRCKIAADKDIYQVSCASIIARVYADSLFAGFGQFWPGYNMENDHGSLSKLHKEKLRQDGPTPIHRVKGYGSEWWSKIMSEEQW